MDVFPISSLDFRGTFPYVTVYWMVPIFLSDFFLATSQMPQIFQGSAEDPVVGSLKLILHMHT